MERVDPFKLYQKIFKFNNFKGLLKKAASYTQTANNIELSAPTNFIVFENYRKKQPSDILFEGNQITPNSLVSSFFSGLVTGVGKFAATGFGKMFMVSFNFLSSGLKNFFILIYHGIITFAKGFISVTKRNVNSLFNWIFRIDPKSALAKESFIVRARETFVKIWVYISTHVINIFKYVINHAKATLLLVGLSIIFLYYSKALSKIYFYIRDKTKKKQAENPQPQAEPVNQPQAEPVNQPQAEETSQPAQPTQPEEEEQIKMGNIYRDFGIMEFSLSSGFNEIKKALSGGYAYLKKTISFLYNNTDKMVVKLIICGLLMGVLAAILSIYSVKQKGD